MIKEKMKQLVGKSIKAYNNEYSKPKIDELKFKEQYQGRIIDCMVGEVDDNYIETPLTYENVVKLEHSKEGVIKIPQIKGKTILIDADGNETDTPGEGCRLISVGEEDNKLIILSKNKNLIDKMVVGDIQQETGNLIPNKTGVISGYIKVKPNTNYNLSEQLIATSNWYAIFEYDKNKQLLNYHYNKRMLTSSKTHYVAFKYHNADNISGKFQFEEGNIATPIIEQKQHKTEILLNEPLYYGNYILDEKLIKKYRKVILDGGEKWENFNINENTISVQCKVTNTDKLQKLKNARTDVKNNILPYAYTQSDYEHYYMDSNFVIFLDKSKNIKSLEEFKNYLGNNNLEFIFELAEPIIEELPNGITLQGFDDTTMYIENSITPTVSYGYNTLIPYKQELLNQKEEVETNTLDIEQNIIPYLMDMEFNLMLMEDE